MECVFQDKGLFYLFLDFGLWVTCFAEPFGDFRCSNSNDHLGKLYGCRPVYDFYDYPLVGFFFLMLPVTAPTWLHVDASATAQ